MKSASFYTSQRHIEMYLCGHYCTMFVPVKTNTHYMANKPWSMKWRGGEDIDRSLVVCPACIEVQTNRGREVTAEVTGCDLCKIRIASVVGWHNLSRQQMTDLVEYKDTICDPKFRESFMESVRRV